MHKGRAHTICEVWTIIFKKRQKEKRIYQIKFLKIITSWNITNRKKKKNMPLKFKHNIFKSKYLVFPPRFHLTVFLWGLNQATLSYPILIRIAYHLDSFGSNQFISCRPYQATWFLFPELPRGQWHGLHSQRKPANRVWEFHNAPSHPAQIRQSWFWLWPR